MTTNLKQYDPQIVRRTFLSRIATGVGGSILVGAGIPPLGRASAETVAKPSADATRFQIACMTLPYRQFTLERALRGIKDAGFEYVAWGTTHVNKPGGKPEPVVATDAPPQRAKDLAQRCRDIGLEPVMMFSGVYPEAENAIKVLTNRILQAAAASIPQVLTFGHTEGGSKKLWIERLKQLAPLAGDHGVMLVVKQHGGSTGTGQACAEIVRAVDHPNIQVNYDAGNVMDYLDVDPIPDIKLCADVVRSFCIKDHREWPKDEDCGPGFGQIDHYELLHPVAYTGRDMPLCCENIFAPVTGSPPKPEAIDELARRARKYIETVTQGLQSAHH